MRWIETDRRLVSAGDHVLDFQLDDALARHRLDRCQLRFAVFEPAERTDADEVRRQTLPEPVNIHPDPGFEPTDGQFGAAFFHSYRSSL
jgi:hypothetical protein